MVNAPCIWITGLPASGKTSVAKALSALLNDDGIDHEILDGDEIRRTLSHGAGFSRSDRNEHNKRVSHVARLLTTHGILTIICLVSPYREARLTGRQIVGEPFGLVWLNCPPETCAARDTKGLWAKAKQGQIDNFTGVNDPYEEPISPDLTILTETTSPSEAAAKIYTELVEPHLGLEEDQ